MNKQEIFETVSKHLFAQGERSYDEVECICQYRGPDGTKCAIGALIPDELYDRKMDLSSYFKEGNGTDMIWSHFPKLVEHLGADNQSLVGELQSVHDISYHWDSSDALRCELKTVGFGHDLDTEFLNDLKFENR